jgi:hypothetical protein
MILLTQSKIMKRDFDELERDSQISLRNRHESDCTEKPASLFLMPLHPATLL